MLGKKVFAAMLATVLGASLFGANAAKAVINLDATDRSSAVATYATETLVEGDDGYSVVMGGSGGLLDVMGKVGLGGPSGTYVTVRFELSGMVFSEAVTAGTAGDLDIAPGSYDVSSIRSGGDEGDAHVSFIVPRDGPTSATDVVTLDIMRLGVKPGVPGSVTMIVTDSVGPEMETTSYLNAVQTIRALDETPMAVNLEATVKERFKSFGGDFKGTLGSFMVGIAPAMPPLLNAADGEEVMLGNIIKLADDGSVTMDSSLTISGDFSFVSSAWLAATNECTPESSPPGLVQKEDEKVLDKLMAQPPSAVAQHFCISVHEGDDAAAIPATAPYMVTTEYAPGTTNAGWPPDPGEYSLGKITRDGTTVYIPYLTTWENYNQRIVVSNRGTNPADYEITFRPEDDVMATPGMYAMGTLEANSTVVLRAMDVVTLEGGTRTAATLVAEAQSSQIDVATVMVNLTNGSTDTVNYEPEPTEGR